MKPRVFNLLTMCVEIGVARGIMRAHKHNDAPDRDDFEREVVRSITEEFDEWFIFDEHNDAGEH
jgi:hypothetical protein